MLEEHDPILIQVTIPLPIGMVYAAFTDATRVERWLCDRAEVDPKLGGRYVLNWEGETKYQSAGTVTAATPEVEFGFTWFGPEPFAALMNRPEPRTRVYLRLQESPEGIDVTLEHQGWGAGEDWGEARSWHFQFWHVRLQRLKESTLKEAYG